MPSLRGETRDQLLARVAFEAVWERDLQSDAVTWQGNMESFFGYRLDEVGNRVSWWRERVHPDDVERVEQVVREAIASDASGWSNEYRSRRRDGWWAWVTSRCAIERDAEGRARRAIGAMIDISRLKDTGRLLQRVLDTLPVGLIVLDRAGDILLHNPAAVDIWGGMIVSGEERRKKSEGFWRGSGQRIAADEWASLRAVKEGLTTRDELIDINTFDGVRKTIKNYAAPIRDSDGVITGVVVVNEDVTERVRAEEALRKTEALLIDAEKLGRTGSWEQNLGSGEIFNTETSRRLFFGDDRGKGARLEDYVEAIHPDDRDRVLASRERLLAGTGPSDIEYRVVWPDGSVHWIFGRATVVRDDAGRPLRAYGTNRDITERVRAEEGLRKTERLLLDAEKLGHTGSWEQDRVGGEIISTEANRRLFFGDDRSKGARFEDYFEAIHPDDRAKVMSSREELHAGTGSGEVEFRVVLPDGSVRWIFGRATIVRDEAGRPLRAFGTHADITERKRAEEELAALSARLLQSQDEERRRIARELHDTTAQNLAALRMDLTALRRSAAAADPSARATLDESIALAERTIAEIRTLSYLLHPPMIEEAGLLPSLRWYAQGFQERSGIAVTLETPDELARLPIETETAVFRIVQEALTNIQRHSGSGVARIRIERETGILKLTIRDEGHGVPPALRGDETMLAAAGVGVAGMRERARALGGKMHVQSDDRGTAIEVRLPIAES